MKLKGPTCPEPTELSKGLLTDATELVLSECVDPVSGTRGFDEIIKKLHVNYFATLSPKAGWCLEGK